MSVGRRQLARWRDDNPGARRSGGESVGGNVRITFGGQIMGRSVHVDHFDQLTLARQHLVFGRRALRTVARRDAFVPLVGDIVAVVAVRYFGPVLVREQIERIDERYGNDDNGEYRQDELETTSLIHNCIGCFSPTRDACWEIRGGLSCSRPDCEL